MFILLPICHWRSGQSDLPDSFHVGDDGLTSPDYWAVRMQIEEVLYPNWLVGGSDYCANREFR
jgi:hypothetical protein